MIYEICPAAVVAGFFLLLFCLFFSQELNLLLFPKTFF